MANFDGSNALILFLDLKRENHTSDANQVLSAHDQNVSTKLVPNARIIRSTGETAVRLLSTPSLSTVIVPDPEISGPEHKELAARLVEYAKGGGNVIFGGLLWTPGYRNNHNINRLFADVFDIPWRIGRQETQLELQMNPAISTILTGRQFRWLNWRYVLTGTYIINVKDDHQVFRLRIVNGEPTTPMEKNRCAVATQKFGNGKLSFIGFSEDEVNAKLIYQAMCDMT